MYNAVVGHMMPRVNRLENKILGIQLPQTKGFYVLFDDHTEKCVHVSLTAPARTLRCIILAQPSVLIATAWKEVWRVNCCSPQILC